MDEMSSMAHMHKIEEEQEVDYENTKVYEIIPTDKKQASAVAELWENPKVDFWTPRTSLAAPSEVMVSPDFQNRLQEYLEKNNVSYKILIQDVDAIISKEKFCQMSTPNLLHGAFNFSKYHRYADMQDYFAYVTKKYRRLATVENIGMSCENRCLTLVRISSGGDNSRPVIFIDAGIHAREWIAPAFALYIIHQLLDNPDNKYMSKKVDWFIIPLLNPDGYEYSHTDNRFWRKNRSKGRKYCGVDLNRNFSFQWLGKGSSKDESSQIYAGPMPFSEPEACCLKEVITKHVERIKLYLTLHSAAQCLLYPWGYTQTETEDAEELDDLAVDVVNAVTAVNGTIYNVGSSANILFPSAGSSRDWVRGSMGIKYAYTLELPGGGEQGFDLPPDEILGVVEEVFEGLRVFHRHIEYTYAKK